LEASESGDHTHITYNMAREIDHTRETHIIYLLTLLDSFVRVRETAAGDLFVVAY
jgi:hypothetical protein